MRQWPEIWWRIKAGWWCDHTTWIYYPLHGRREPLWTKWERVDAGMRQIRYCKQCGKVEWR
jgi:hypothetical protein